MAKELICVKVEPLMKTKIKIVAQNQDDLPVWRKRKNKKPMIMIDEIELYNN